MHVCVYACLLVAILPYMPILNPHGLGSVWLPRAKTAQVEACLATYFLFVMGQAACRLYKLYTLG